MHFFFITETLTLHYISLLLANRSFHFLSYPFFDELFSRILKTEWIDIVDCNLHIS